ncbi:hypothetical protein [Streptomyces sp. KR55]|uniref:hypothetical protein n=1 Tax=Streptomyces sp. KR55 TaxID=3457425 RepID=UPI003FD62D9C
MPKYAAMANSRAVAAEEEGASDPEVAALGVPVDTSLAPDGFASPVSDDVHPVAIRVAVAP